MAPSEDRTPAPRSEDAPPAPWRPSSADEWSAGANTEDAAGGTRPDAAHDKEGNANGDDDTTVTNSVTVATEDDSTFTSGGAPVDVSPTENGNRPWKRTTNELSSSPPEQQDPGHELRGSMHRRRRHGTRASSDETTDAPAQSVTPVSFFPPRRVSSISTYPQLVLHQIAKEELEQQDAMAKLWLENNQHLSVVPDEAQDARDESADEETPSCDSDDGVDHSGRKEDNLGDGREGKLQALDDQPLSSDGDAGNEISNLVMMDVDENLPGAGGEGRVERSETMSQQPEQDLRVPHELGRNDEISINEFSSGDVGELDGLHVASEPPYLSPVDVASESMDDADEINQIDGEGVIVNQLCLASAAGDVVVAPVLVPNEDPQESITAIPELSSKEEAVNKGMDADAKTKLMLASAGGEVMVMAPMFVAAINNQDEIVEPYQQDQKATLYGAFHATPSDDNEAMGKYAGSHYDMRKVVYRGNAAESTPDLADERLESLPSEDIDAPSSREVAPSALDNRKARHSRAGYIKLSSEQPQPSTSITTGNGSKSRGRKLLEPNGVDRQTNGDDGHNDGHNDGSGKPMLVGAYAIRPQGQNTEDQQDYDHDMDTIAGVLSEKSSRSLKSSASTCTATTSIKPSPSARPPMSPDDGSALNGLAVAVPIDEDGEDLENQRKVKYVARAVKEDLTEKPHILQSRRVQLGIGAGLLIIFTILLSILLTGRGSGGSGDGTTEAPTMAPTSMKEAEYLDFLASKVDASTDVYNRESAAFLAADWISNVDSQQLALASPRLLQRYVLAQFYFATSSNGNNPWKLCNPPFLEVGNGLCPSSSWLGDEDECIWSGVVCNGSGDVSHLILESLGLSGSLPADLALLSNIQVLNLGENRLTGTVPSQYAKSFTQLHTLTLTSNLLTGDISSNFLDLVSDSLIDLDLTTNRLIGTLSPHVGRLTNLQKLWIGENNLGGSIPTEVGNLAALDSFYVDGNEFYGTIPTEIGRLKNATFLSLTADFSGTIPTQLAEMTSLQVLFLRMNHLSGSIPLEIYNMTQLQRLQLHQNKLTGTLSTLIGQMSSLDDLRVSRNKLTGPIPSEIQNLTKLRAAWLHLNEFTGPVPSGICELRATTLEFLNADCYPVVDVPPNPCLDGCCTTCCERETEYCKDL